MNRIIFAIILVFFIFNCERNKIEIGYITWDPAYELETNDSVYFIDPYDATVTFSDQIAISDRGDVGIKLYNINSGKFIRKIGKRGRGPGEFQNIQGISVREDSLFVLDVGLRRASVFLLDGTYVDSFTIEDYNMNYSSLEITNDNKFLFYVDSQDMETAFFGHEYNSNFSVLESKFIKPSEIYENVSTTEFLFHGMSVGSVLKKSENEILIAPLYYSGKIFHYKRDNSENWELVNTISGFVENKIPNTVLDNDQGRKPDGVGMHALIPGNRYFVIYNNTTRGLFKIFDNQYIHFTEMDYDGNRVFGFELFDMDLNLLGYNIIKSEEISLSGEPNFFDLFVLQVDSDDKIYVASREGGENTVKVFKLDKSKLEMK
ncbi:MAG: BF3164 family lipoprotein [Balneola sp.]